MQGYNTMKYKNIFLLFRTICFIVFASSSFLHTNEPDQTNEIIEQTATTEQMISFSYDNEDIITIINTIASLQSLNIVLPPTLTGTKSTDLVKVTLHLPDKISIQEAWNIVVMLLDNAGYITVPHGSLIKIKKKEERGIAGEPLPTYIGVTSKQLPKNNQNIRYIHYLRNIRVNDDDENELIKVLKNILPETALVKADITTNAIIMVTRSECIQSALPLIEQLDTAGFQETVDIIPLRHTSAKMVAELINDKILKTEPVINPYRLDARKSKETSYFSHFTKVIPEKRSNKLIVLGRPQSIERLKKFIYTYIDTEPDTGQSILHVYQLQYLDAEQFAEVLRKIVENQGEGRSGQSMTQPGAEGGPERFFESIVIYADKPRSGAEETKYYGGNKLIVAARNEDWKQIKKLIEELDLPKSQVLIEVLIADLSADDVRQLGSETRMPNKIPLLDGVQFQSAQLAAPPIISPPPSSTPFPPDATIASDLLSNAIPVTVGQTTSLTNLANIAAPGTTLISLNDNNGSTWSLLEILQLFNNTKVISHPHVIATHNTNSKVSIGQQRVIPGNASGATGGTTNVEREKVDALLEINLTPRITAGNIVNLSIDIKINDYITAIPTANLANARTMRDLKTNANVESGGIIALGGLTQTRTDRVITEFPVLSKIPILGWFLKSERDVVTKNNLTILITPTIIQPRLRGGVNDYTRDYIDHAKEQSGDYLFTNVKDPITRWFFKTPTETDTIIDEFTQRDERLLPEFQDKKNKPKIKNKKSKQETKNEILASEKSTQHDNGQSAINTVSQPIAPTVHESLPFDQNYIVALPDLKTMIENDDNPFDIG